LFGRRVGWLFGWRVDWRVGCWRIDWRDWRVEWPNYTLLIWHGSNWCDEWQIILRGGGRGRMLGKKSWQRWSWCRWGGVAWDKIPCGRDVRGGFEFHDRKDTAGGRPVYAFAAKVRTVAKKNAPFCMSSVAAVMKNSNLAEEVFWNVGFRATYELVRGVQAGALVGSVVHSMHCGIVAFGFQVGWQLIGECRLNGALTGFDGLNGSFGELFVIPSRHVYQLDTFRGQVILAGEEIAFVIDKNLFHFVTVGAV